MDLDKGAAPGALGARCGLRHGGSCWAGAQVRRQLRRRAKLQKNYEAECAIAVEEGLDKPKPPEQLLKPAPSGGCGACVFGTGHEWPRTDVAVALNVWQAFPCAWCLELSARSACRAAQMTKSGC